MFKHPFAVGPVGIFKRVAILGALAAAGCASTYVQPVDSPDVAHVTFNRMPGLPGLGNIQQLILADGPQCDAIQQLDSFSPLSSNFGRVTQRQILLPGGVRTHIVALSTSAGGMGYSSTCKNMAIFTPRAGGRYEVTHIFEPTSCHVEVIDSATGAPPVDLEFRVATRRCTENLE